MCSGPKSAWKALYNRLLSMVKYTGGLTCLVAAVGPACALLERFTGDWVLRSRYLKGVSALGGLVNEAR